MYSFPSYSFNFISSEGVKRVKQAAKRVENALGTAMEWKSSSGISNIGVEFANAWDGLHFDFMNFVFISNLFPEHHRLLSSYSSPSSLKGSFHA